MSFSNLSIFDRITKYELIFIFIKKHTIIEPLIAKYGYDQKTFKSGTNYFQRAFKLCKDQILKYEEQYAATTRFRTAQKEFYNEYITHVKLARIALKKDRVLLRRLELIGKRALNYNKLVSQAEAFYSIALKEEEVQKKIRRFNLGKTQLQETQNLFEEMKERKLFQKKMASEAQQITEKRNKAMAVIDSWMADFMAVAKIALAHKPQLLEQLKPINPSK